ncbi:hypothetical protein [Enterococcus avium]|uniref:hypothetical protein n=1 Tax=Enterococcus avium TaxID=33945 RepID=UPI001F57D5C9|nr:hypothetical protein [Enterococcus avium]
MKIKLITDAEMSEILTKRHEGRVTDENTIYQLTDKSNIALDNEFLYKNKAKIVELENGSKLLSVVLDTRAVLELERGSVGVEQVQVYNFELKGAHQVDFVGIDVATKNEFAQNFTAVLSPENIKTLLDIIELETDENKEYAQVF